MKFLVDADSCPKSARELVVRRAKKLEARVIFAANRRIEADGAQMEICSNKENAADDRIVELAEKGDLVITRDIPLAKRVVEKEAAALDDRGRVFNQNNINELLSVRNFTVGLADNGLGIERTANYGKKELKSFADSLDRLLAKLSANQRPDTVRGCV
jgi:uncharacterized protein YaiI (UPF0178 family)